MGNKANSTPRLAVVIGSGSVKCAAAIGMYQVLERENIPIDLVVGCSGGSIYAATYAMGYSPAKIRELSLSLWTREITQQRQRRSLLRAMFPKWLNFNERFGLVEDELVMQRLRAAFGEGSFAEAKIPLYMAATDFHTGEQVILSSGRLVDAIRASIAIPFTFEPYQVGERLLIDGFMSDPLPVNIAIQEGASVILAMGFESPYQSKIKSAGRFAFQMSSIMTNNLLKAKFAFHNIAHHAELIPIMPQFEQRIRLFDTEKIPQIIEAGAQAMEAELPYLRRLLNLSSNASSSAADESR